MAFWHRPTADEIADRIIQKASLNTPRGLTQLPTGAVTTSLTQEQARALANGSPLQPTEMLPRNPMDAISNFGPSTPLPSQPLDPLQTWGRPYPRRSEYPVAWNLQLKPQRIVPFEILKACADQCDVVRRCIDIRKQAIQEQDWDIALTDAATRRFIDQGEVASAAPGFKVRTAAAAKVRAERAGREKFAPEIDRLRTFLEEPDPINRLSWTEWLGNLLEEHFVIDALSIYPWRTYGREVAALVILDGSTIKPLLDEYGNTPQPPYPAFQQILYGYPRGEFQAAPNPDAEFLSDQLFYRPRDRRSGTPYGCSPTEKALPIADLWLKRQAWLRAEYSDGATPQLMMKADGTMSPSDRQQHEASFNDELSGDSKARHRIKIIPAGFDPVQLAEMAQKYTNVYDQFLITQIGSKFAVMPTQLGIIPERGVFGGGATQPGEQDISETLGDGPLEEWVIDTVNAVCRLYLQAPPELTLVFSGGGLDEDQSAVATRQQIQVNDGTRTLNDICAENGDDLYEFPEADTPFVMTGTGPVFLPGLIQQKAEAAQLAQSLPSADKPDQPNAPSTPDGKPGEQSDKAAAMGMAEWMRIGDRGRELHAFTNFVAGKIDKGVTWTRDFEFKTINPSLAKALNAAGQRRDMEAIKVLAATVPKALAADTPPQTQRADQIADRVAEAVAQALGGGWTAASLLEAVFALYPNYLQEATEDQIVQALTQLGFIESETTTLFQVLADPVSEAYDAGWQFVSHAPEDALRLGGLQAALDQLRIELQGVSRTSVDRIGNALAQAIQDGSGSRVAAEAIAPILNDPKRAEVIARTEIARAMEGAMLAQARTVGGMDKRWSDAPDACPICQGNTDQGLIPLDEPFPGGALHPPQHPRCRCALILVPAKIAATVQ